MRIGLIRHGETDWNARMLLQGSADIPLNERGVEQAHDAARLLRGQPWSRVVTSPLSRARETGEIIAAALGLDAPTVVPDLVERSFGNLEGESIYQSDGSRQPLNDPTIEDADFVRTRALTALSELASQEPGGEVLAIAHGSVIRLTLDVLLGWKAPHISNLALTVIERNPELPHGFDVRIANGYPLAGN